MTQNSDCAWDRAGNHHQPDCKGTSSGSEDLRTCGNVFCVCVERLLQLLSLLCTNVRQCEPVSDTECSRKMSHKGWSRRPTWRCHGCNPPAWSAKIERKAFIKPRTLSGSGPSRRNHFAHRTMGKSKRGLSGMMGQPRHAGKYQRV